MAACPGPRMRGNAAVAWSPPATSRRRGRPPATFLPRAAHAATAHAPLSHAAVVRRRSIPSTSTPPRASSLFAPLSPIAFLGREDLPGASPLRPTPSLVFTFPSTTEPWSTSPTSPFSPTSATSTPHRHTPPPDRHHHREPVTVSLPPPFAPNWDPRRPGLLPGHFPANQRLPAGQIWSVSRRRRGNSALPCFFGDGPKC
jgi:hypothetical protein